MFQRFTETQARIKQDRRHPCCQDFCRTPLQESTDLGHHIGVGGVALHGARLALHVHQSGGCSGIGTHLPHGRVAQGGHVVDQVCARPQRRIGHLRFHGVHADQHLFFSQGTDNGQNPVKFLGSSYRNSPRTGAFAAHINHQCPSITHGTGCRHRCPKLAMSPAIAERVGGNVQNAQDGAAAPLHFPAIRNPRTAWNGKAEDKGVNLFRPAHQVQSSSFLGA